MTFQIGDRVKSDGIVTDDAVHVVSWTDGTWMRLDDSVSQQWSVNRFELYAKAGEFVVGDRVIWTHPESGHTFKPGDMLTIAEPKYYVGTDTLWGGEGPWWFHKSQVRLATPEEIAAADLAAPEFSKVDPSIVIEPKVYDWKPDLARVGDGPDHPSVAAYEERVATLKASCGPSEIPAADFDFDQIKAGDEVLVRLKVHSAGLDNDGDVVCLGRPEEPLSLRYTDPSEVVSVIPKPKTLRERAIEAALSGLPGVDPTDETKGVVLAGGQVISLHALVDLVLAEVGKGR